MNIAYYLHDENNTDLLERQLLWFKSRYQMISANQLAEVLYNNSSIKNFCHLTIDDGWLSTYNVVFPLLKKHNIPVSIFVSPLKTVDETSFWYMEYKDYDKNILKEILIQKNYFTSDVTQYPLDLIFKEMNIDDVNSVLKIYREINHISTVERGVINLSEIEEMIESGLVEVGAHTCNHPILSNETAERSTKEIVDSIEMLGDLLHRKIRSFAYPNGLYSIDYTNRELDIVKSAGIKLAYSVDPGKISKSTNPLNIPRVGSLKRLKLGNIGLMLPSFHDQKKPREAVFKLKL